MQPFVVSVNVVVALEIAVLKTNDFSDIILLSPKCITQLRCSNVFNFLILLLGCLSSFDSDPSVKHCHLKTFYLGVLHIFFCVEVCVYVNNV